MKRVATAHWGLVVALCGVATAQANNDVWKNAVSGTWSVASNWVDGSVPIGGDQASFQIAGTYGISFNASPAAIQDLFVITAGDNVTFVSVGAVRTLSVTSASGGLDAIVSDGATLTLGTTGQPFNLSVGDNLYSQVGGTLNIANGSTVNTADFICSTAGTINVAAASSLNATGTGTIGAAFNAGTLNISGGGSVTTGAGSLGDVSGTSGTANIDGTGSKWTTTSLDVGKVNTGTLNITNGGTLISKNASIGAQTGSSGEVYVTGTGSTWKNSTGDTQNLVVGSSGTGKLSISAGGAMFGYNTFIGFGGSAMSSATIDGAASTWTNTNGIWIGGTGTNVNQGGNGTLTIKGGAHVASAFGFVGYSPGSVGVATVADAGSSWTMTDSLAIGLNGSGTLNVNLGGTVSVGETLFAYNSVHLQGGTLDAKTINTLADGPFDWTSGTLHVGTFNGNLVNHGGNLSPGHAAAAGFNTVTGNYTQQAAGVMTIEIGAHAVMTSANDFVNVNGVATLGGELHLSFLNGFVPTGTESFGILRGTGGVNGAFSNVADGQRLATSDGIGSFVVHYGGLARSITRS